MAMKRSGIAIRWSALCTPGMGVNLWGASPLYVNPVNEFNSLTKVFGMSQFKVGTCKKKQKQIK